MRIKTLNTVDSFRLCHFEKLMSGINDFCSPIKTEAVYNRAATMLSKKA